MDCSKRQAIEPVFGQLVSEPAGIEAGEGGVVEFESGTCAHTLLLSKKLCTARSCKSYAKWRLWQPVDAI